MGNDLLANDSLRSLTSGMGDPNFDKSASVYYGSHLLSDDMLLNAYRNSWVAKKVVNIPALDALRKGRDWQADQEAIKLIEKEERRLGFWQKMVECKTKARLWGGAAIVIGVEGNEPYSEPFDPEMVKKGGLPFLTVMTRRELMAGQLTTDPTSEFYSKPEFYEVSGHGEQHVKIHPSRLVVQLGEPHPDPWNAIGSHVGWSDSCLQHVYTSLMNADAVPANVASLVFEANVDTFGVPDLMEKLSTKSYETRLLNRLTLANVSKSVNKALIHDTDEEIDRKQINFAGLPDVIQQFLLIVSGAADIPLTRFLGQTPSGLSSTGEGDMKNYYDRVTAIQELEIEPALWRCDEALLRSALGERPDDIFYEWTPLEQINEKDEAEIGLKNVQAAEILGRSGLFDPEELRDAVSNQLIENKFYPGLAEAMKREPDFDVFKTEEELAMQQQLLNGGSSEEDDPTPVADAAPRTLYMRRDVLNAAEIIAHYRGQGVKKLYEPESMHVTIVYSKTPVDWMKFGEPWNSKITVEPGGPRLHELFGSESDVLVLQFASGELDYRHRVAREFGASSDHPEYQPHISLTLNGKDVDLDNVEPWQGEIVLGPEIYQEIKQDNWRELVSVGDMLAGT